MRCMIQTPTPRIPRNSPSSARKDKSLRTVAPWRCWYSKETFLNSMSQCTSPSFGSQATTASESESHASPLQGVLEHSSSETAKPFLHHQVSRLRHGAQARLVQGRLGGSAQEVRHLSQGTQGVGGDVGRGTLGIPHGDRRRQRRNWSSFKYVCLSLFSSDLFAVQHPA